MPGTNPSAMPGTNQPTETRGIHLRRSTGRLVPSPAYLHLEVCADGGKDYPWWVQSREHTLTWHWGEPVPEWDLVVVGVDGRGLGLVNRPFGARDYVEFRPLVFTVDVAVRFLEWYREAGIPMFGEEAVAMLRPLLLAFCGKGVEYIIEEPGAAPYGRSALPPSSGP
jgi:hypothetical protein